MHASENLSESLLGVHTDPLSEPPLLLHLNSVLLGGHRRPGEGGLLTSLLNASPHLPSLAVLTSSKQELQQDPLGCGRTRGAMLAGHQEHHRKSGVLSCFVFFLITLTKESANLSSWDLSEVPQAGGSQCFQTQPQFSRL